MRNAYKLSHLFLFSLLLASSIASIQELHAFLSISSPSSGEYWKITFFTYPILMVSSWSLFFPLTLLVFLSWMLNSLLITCVAKFLLEELDVRILSSSLALKESPPGLEEPPVNTMGAHVSVLQLGVGGCAPDWGCGCSRSYCGSCFCSMGGSGGWTDSSCGGTGWARGSEYGWAWDVGTWSCLTQSWSSFTDASTLSCLLLRLFSLSVIRSSLVSISFTVV